MTYKPKSALQDSVRALNKNLQEIIKITTVLPDEFDELTLEDHQKILNDVNSTDQATRIDAQKEYNKYELFYNYWLVNPQVVDIAFRLVGKIKSQGTHAAGLIIANRPVEELIPLSYINRKDRVGWVSQWTEGKNTQLSKFGLVKFDILGLGTMQYIWKCCNLIEQCHNIKIDWDRMNPLADPPYLGYEINQDGSEKKILMNDRLSLEMCNDLKTESVFQIETQIQKSIIRDGKVKTFWDLVLFNALGRPGPIAMIPMILRNRDDKLQKWKEGMDDRIYEILKDTHGYICFQEQLQTMWIRLAGFTIPEAEAARKIVSKKWQDKLPIIEKRWKEGASKTIGKDEADRWWTLMVDFGRYSFNRSHAICYSIITFRCLYLKAHYPTQWWASVLSSCHQEKMKKYLNAARTDGVKFGTIDINNLSVDFAVLDNKLIPGLKSIKGMGDKGSNILCSLGNGFTNIDEVIIKSKKSKTMYERLIKLGAFDKLHHNRKGLWKWYQYKYGSGPEVSELRKEINEKLMPLNEIQKVRDMRIEEYKQLYPKRKKIPNSILNWMPKFGPNSDKPTRNEVMNLFQDYSLKEKIDIEKQLLGYYWNSPLAIYRTNKNCTIENAKKSGIMEVVIDKVMSKKSKNDNQYYVFEVTDGIQTTEVIIWDSIFNGVDKKVIEEGRGIRMEVSYNKERNSFKGDNIVSLDVDDGPVF